MRALAAVLFAFLAGCAASRHAECEALLREQAAAWSRGDLEGFASGYARSPDLVFATAGGLQVGYDALVARYRQRYPDAAAMGRLDFTDLAFTELSPDEVLASGGWRVRRAEGELAGRFALVLRRLPEGWRVVLDYTTSLPAGA